ncbi:hypothetical protein [Candidatus Formimonas warabiya]|uniref:Uncharacterized protein n=1 Tax=Formimonas warabiya TaxID=1761012 RepID=A0A3G1KR15_FORW1|nr:hypothetical protein [Candidatus Formimonas warabiya]ATW24901.1 hypothetical protein DCMF_09070 [Candidatus Formimonas warabiya]
MLTLAMNYIGPMEDTNFISRFLKLFPEFKVVRLFPKDDETEEGPLQICRPENPAELLKKIQINTDALGRYTEVRGPRTKVQKAVRSMFFTGTEKEKILLDGAGGMQDYPWSIQIVLAR